MRPSLDPILAEWGWAEWAPCLLVAWAGISFVCCLFARPLSFMVAGWPFSYWMAAQGAVLGFIAIVVVYATVMRRLAPEDSLEPPDA